MNNKLSIADYNDFKRIISFIELSEILIKQCTEERERDFDCLTEGIYTLKSNLETFKTEYNWFICTMEVLEIHKYMVIIKLLYQK